VFLLTDGLANVGIQDPEQIASQASQILRTAGVGTSTFGIGADYDEGLLGPLAVAGGGQFYHLANPSEIATAFASELGDLLRVVARSVRVELAVDSGVTLDLVSAYHLTVSPDGHAATIAVGDLLGDDERHVVVRVGFPQQRDRLSLAVRARALWRGEDGECQTEWHEVAFDFADDVACDREPRDRAAMHWVGLHHVARARLQAIGLSRHGDLAAARELLRAVARRLAEYANGDPDLQAGLRELSDLEHQLDVPLPSPVSKQMYAGTQAAMRSAPKRK
jgi:Ca-activated chloride channel family protein